MEILSSKIDSAEKRLSHGKASEEDIKGMNPVLPPSLVARHKLALIMDAIVKGESTYFTMKAELEKVRDNPFTPANFKVEAGYMLTLVEKMEGLQRFVVKARECSRENDELRKNLDQVRKEYEDIKKENEDIKKQIELMSYKLKKLEQIHIESEKRRVKQ